MARRSLASLKECPQAGHPNIASGGVELMKGIAALLLLAVCKNFEPLFGEVVELMFLCVRCTSLV
jgi:hypothetical protein